jgi:hypothetical protein
MPARIATPMIQPLGREFESQLGFELPVARTVAFENRVLKNASNFNAVDRAPRPP